MLKVSLSDEDFSNLKVFLDRVNLIGKEVPAYLNIMQNLSLAEVIDEKKESEKEDKKEVN